MQSKIVRLLLVLTAGAFVAGAQQARAQEHPEHPAQTKEHPEHPAEHAEHPEHPGSSAELTMDTLGDAIEMFATHLGELEGGYFCVYDEEAGEPLALTLKKVHRERLASLGDGVYFACADFDATNGKVYDLDIFMQQTEGGHFMGLMPTKVTVHKENGVARYTWQEKDGVWSMKAAD